MLNKKERQALIAKLVGEKRFSSQSELVEELAKMGVRISQASVSRDLRELGFLKRRLPNGSVGYCDAAQANTLGSLPKLRRKLRDLLVFHERVNNFLVLKTSPGEAQALAAALDEARFPEVVGTVAGDDTILVVLRTDEEAMKFLKTVIWLRGT